LFVPAISLNVDEILSSVAQFHVADLEQCVGQIRAPAYA